MTSNWEACKPQVIRSETMKMCLKFHLSLATMLCPRRKSWSWTGLTLLHSLMPNSRAPIFRDLLDQHLGCWGMAGHNFRSSSWSLEQKSSGHAFFQMSLLLNGCSKTFTSIFIRLIYIIILQSKCNIFKCCFLKSSRMYFFTTFCGQMPRHILGLCSLLTHQDACTRTVCESNTV